jgi:hypothetical protein
MLNAEQRMVVSFRPLVSYKSIKSGRMMPWYEHYSTGTILLLKTSYRTNLMAKVVLVLYFIAGQSKASWSSKGISPNVPS